MNDVSLSLSEMAATFAHEVRNPLALAMVNINILELGCKNEEDVNRFNAVKRELTKIAELMMELTELAADKPLRKNVTPVKETIEDILPAYITAYSREIEFITYIEKEISAAIQPKHFRIILNNILKNAVEAVKAGSNKHGKIIISVKTNTDRILISVQDNGIGMDDDTKENAAKPYFTTKENGSGIGLFATGSLLNRYGGDMKVSGELFIGCTVEISLPSSRV